MAGEGEDEAAAIERQLEQQLQEQRSSLAAVDEALAADPSNADLLEEFVDIITNVMNNISAEFCEFQEQLVHEELLAAIKDAEEGLLHLKRSRLLKQVDEIFPDEASISQSPDAIEPLDPDDVEPEPLESHDFSVGSKCRFRHNNGRWYNGCIIGFEGSSDARISFLTPTSENMSMCKFFLQQRCRFGSNCRMSHGVVIPTKALKRFTPTRWEQSLVGSSILASSGYNSGLWRRAELESWDDNLKLGQVVFQDDGSSARLPSDSLSVSEYADMSDEDEGSLTDEESEFSDDADQEDGSVHQGLGLLEFTNFSGIQTDTMIFAKWEHHTRGVASKMMAKMGYREGMGLGVSGQGMLDPIPVKVLPPKQSLDHALAASEADGGIGSGKKRSRGGKRKREKKFAEQARAAKAEEAERSVFNFINSHLVSQDVPQGSTTKVRKGSSVETHGHAKKEDRRSLVAYDEEVKELRIRVEKLEEMKNRNRKDKAVFEAASRKLEETRKALADAEATHASATNDVTRKEKEKKWLKF